MIIYFFINNNIKQCFIKKVQEVVFDKWVNDFYCMDRCLLVFIYLVYVLDVLENVFVFFLDEQYDLVIKRVWQFFDLDFEVECLKVNINEVLWVVVVVFIK